MKSLENDIAIITSGFLPLPASKGGAVETLIDTITNENEKSGELNFTIFSIYDKEAEKLSKNKKTSRYVYYKPKKMAELLDKITYFVFTKILRKNGTPSTKYCFQRFFYINWVSKIINKHNFQKILIENNPTLFLCLKKRNNYKKYEGRYYYHLHNEINRFYGCKNIMEKSNKIICVSDYIKKYVLNRIDIEENKVVTVRNCIQTDLFERRLDEQVKNNIRKKFGLSKEDYVIVFTGRIVKEKGIDELIEAIKITKVPNLKLLIVGSQWSSADKKNKFIKKLEKKCNDIKDKIVFTGYIDYNKINEIYKISDLAVLPSIWQEPAGLTILEASVSAVPLITTKSGGITEYIDGKNCIVLDIDSQLIENISNSIKEVYYNKNKYIEMSKRNQAFSRKFNNKDYYKEFKKNI